MQLGSGSAMLTTASTIVSASGDTTVGSEGTGSIFTPSVDRRKDRSTLARRSLQLELGAEVARTRCAVDALTPEGMLFLLEQPSSLAPEGPRQRANHEHALFILALSLDGASPC